jgi:hypothetical protein
MTAESTSEPLSDLAFLLRTDAVDYARLWRAFETAKELYYVGKELTQRGMVARLPAEGLQDLHLVSLATKRPMDVIEMLAKFAVSDDLEDEQYNDMARLLTDDAVRLVCDGVAALRRVCSPYADLLVKVAAIESMDRVSADVAEAKRKCFRVIAGGKS